MVREERVDRVDDDERTARPPRRVSSPFPLLTKSPQCNQEQKAFGLTLAKIERCLV